MTWAALTLTLAACGRCGFEGPGDPLDGSFPDGPTDATGSDAGRTLPQPLVLHSLEGSGPVGFMADEAPPLPDVSLSPAARTPLGVAYVTGGVGFSGGRLEATSATSDQLTAKIVASGSFTAEAWAASADLLQGGPARIVTLSRSGHARAFTLGQSQQAFVLRLRSSVTDESGSLFQREVSAFSGMQPHHLVVVFDGTTSAQRVYVDGLLVAQDVHQDSMGTKGTLDWQPGERFGLGDEFNASRPWAGTLYQVAIWDVALTDDQIQALYARGPPS